jgi:hypothetical protein
MLGLVPPHDHGEERCLLVPPTADGHPEHGPGDATLGVADLGLVGEVAGEADARLGHVLPLPVAWPGGLPALGPGDGGHRGMPQDPQGQAAKPTKSARLDQPPAIGRLRSRVGWWGACGWESGMPAPSGQIPPPWAWWENEAPTTRAAAARPRRSPELDQMAVGGGGVVMALAPRPASSVRVAVLGRSDLLDDRVWPLLG